MTIYEGITLGFIGVGIIFLIVSIFFDQTKQAIVDDELSMDDDVFRKQINLVNDKILELNDYHSFVQEEIEKKHKELLFLYQMISDKEKDVRQVQVEIEQVKVSLLEMKAMSEEAKAGRSFRRSVPETDHNENIQRQDGHNVSERFRSDEELKEETCNKNRQIIKLRKQGYNEKEIAKILDIGRGEVRLVLNLFD